MIRVIIADDEDRICQLIKALVDWKEMGLEIVGVAHNGLEALEQVQKLRPDILITDIRMPGCNGLELVQQAKEFTRELEIVIISGYAHFEYAQQAIRFGVGEYLLKPIGRAELTATLEKLKGRIYARRKTEQSKEELLRKAEMDEKRLQINLVSRLLEEEPLPLSMETLQDTHHLQVQPGNFQAFWLKMDCAKDSLGEDSAAALMDKAQELLERCLSGKCFVMISAIRGFSCIGIMNYGGTRQEELRRALKSSLSQMEVQKNIFSPVTFSMAVGAAVKEPELLQQSMKEAELLIQDRIVKGTGRLLERMGTSGSFESEKAMEHYLRGITHAVESLSVEEADRAVDALQEEIHRSRDVRGHEIFEMVYSAADIFSARAQMPDRGERMKEFRNQCTQCSSTEELLACLGAFQDEYIKAVLSQRENDAIRPIRRAKQYIQNHYSEPITLEEVSGIVGLSPAYFSVLFKKTEGEGFVKYLTNVRLEQAKILLRETNVSVAEICRKVGYNDSKHFTHIFEKTVGIKPATYRKLYG